MKNSSLGVFDYVSIPKLSAGNSRKQLGVLGKVLANRSILKV